jgi:acetyltransferase-like isoleucine patch superfamily enzyme
MIVALTPHLRLWRHRKNWRRLNPHNRTVAGTFFDPGKVSVGNLTYGGLNVTEGCYPNEHLDIGHLCSISREVQFLLAGQHFTNRPTMFPVCGLATGKRGGDGYSRGPIVVGSDVWIGIGAMILSGVTIGQGAVVGAGSVVARDVPPYAVVAGNRAEIVKYRFPEEVVAELLKLDFARLTREQCLRHLDVLSRPLNLDDLRRMIAELERDS